MDIDRVRYFNMFAETGSLVRASELLGISQPALSKALKLLENEVGLKLFEPDGRGLKLTQAGEAFRKETSDLLTKWLQVTEKIKQNAEAAPMRLGTFEVFSTYFLRRLTSTVDFKSLELHEYGPGKLENALLNNVVDLGITYVPIPKAGLEFMEVSKIRMGVFGINKLKGTYQELPFVVPLSPVEGAPSKVVGIDGWPDHKFPRKIAYRVALMESALELCRQGQCVAYLPSFVVEIHNQMVLPEHRLQEFSSPIPAKERMQPVYLIHRSQSSETKLHRLVAKALRGLNSYSPQS
jgi:DNA-binding transcriptional LysR family regulator